MGYGDRLMAIGDAWDLYQRDPQGRKVAIGDGALLATDAIELGWRLDFFLANQQEADAGDVQWVHSYPSHRPYIDYPEMRRQLELQGQFIEKHRKLVSRLGRYIWRDDYRAKPAPVQLMPGEMDAVQAWIDQRPAEVRHEPFALIEPYIKSVAPPSKQYPVESFAEVARRLSQVMPVYQISSPDRPTLPGLESVRPSSFREALAFIKAADIYIGPEGGLHHGAAAMETKAVVVFGGYVSPQVTGYPELHVNLTGGAERSCGTRYGLCPHCAEAFSNITPEHVVDEARRLIAGEHL
jgi:ADP-heptose:LPS heptosyltransferase